MSLKEEYKRLSGFVRQMDKSYWCAEETEKFCAMNGKIGNAVLYSLTKPSQYNPVLAKTCFF